MGCGTLTAGSGPAVASFWKTSCARPLKAPVLAILDGVSGPAFQELTAPFYQPTEIDYESLLTTFIEQPGETLRSLAVFHVGELRLRGLQGRIAKLRSQETSLFVGQMFDRTLRLLEATG